MARSEYLAPDRLSYFISCRVRGARRPFEDARCARLLLTIMEAARRRYGFRKYAYVILPDQYLLLVGRGAGQQAIALMILEINDRTEEALARISESNHELWEDEPNVLVIYTWRTLFERLNHIHNRPVECGLVEHAEDYIFSSAQYYQDKYGRHSFDIEQLMEEPDTVEEAGQGKVHQAETRRPDRPAAGTKGSVLSLGDCEFEMLTRADEFLGLGKIRIGDTLVRSGRLPLRPYTQTFTGLELAETRLLGVDEMEEEVRLRLQVLFRPLPVKMMRDHSFDPIHDTGDWDVPVVAGAGRLDLVLTPAADRFDGTEFRGFSYHYEYEDERVPLFYLLDMASWELGGNIVGATVISQSSCSAPTVTFQPDTAWTTEGVIHWADTASAANPVMTHNLPRWASHQAFDFQYKGDKTLLGVFERVGLIRTVLCREAGKAELKTFDKYIFDESLAVRTPAKSILLNTARKTPTAQRNLWTRVFDAVHSRARAEFGLQEEPLVPKLCMNYWDNFVIDDYRKDLLPAAASLGFQALFIDNMNKSAATERCPHPDWHWNMCCGHEYEVAPRLGGPAKLRAFVEDCKALGIRPFAWTNNAQALSSPVNAAERDERGWFVRLEDTRLKYGGAYAGCLSVLDFKVDDARRYWVDSLKKIKEETGLDAYLFDSFYNLGFMPVSYRRGHPTTQWRELLAAIKELQDAGIHFMIESFGPFGSPQHGCPASYALPENVFACYKITGGFGYTTVPSGAGAQTETEAQRIYRFFAHMASPSFPLFHEGKRLDQLWTEDHKRALADYNRNRIHMHKRFLQEDDQSVLWHDAAGERATLWNFVERDVRLPGTVTDVTVGRELPRSDVYHLEASHTYAITGVVPLPEAVCSASR